MDHDRYADEHIRGILRDVRRVAIVGASANPVRPSYFVATYLMSKGYEVIPVNPGHAGRPIAGAMTYETLAAIPGRIDLVDIFRNSQAAAGVVDEVLALVHKPLAIWMQFGVCHDEAAARAEAAGIRVVMNRCPKIEYARLCGEIGWAGVASGVVSSRKPKMIGGIQRYSITGGGENEGSQD